MNSQIWPSIRQKLKIQFIIKVSNLQNIEVFKIAEQREKSHFLCFFFLDTVHIFSPKVDPLFQMMSATFDEGGTNGLLLNNLQCYDDTQKLMLDSSSIVSPFESCMDDTEQTCSMDVNEMTGCISLNHVNCLNNSWCNEAPLQYQEYWLNESYGIIVW